MSYLVLARKYRPRGFEEVAGQEVILKTLKGAIESGRIGHAYLFTGPRGTGKTTTARILAKALNCELGPTSNPCGKCERCLALDAGAEADVIEIDAASNTSVDDVRLLRDQAAYKPLAARFKIFIIDEVHMLSKAAFNALLKTLEEPPEHVKFLFATTEPHKVLDTILSRCQVLKLSPLPEERIVHRLQEVFAAEGIDAESGVLEEIARRARGGMRDALSIADQLLAMVGDKPRLADMERLSGEGQGVSMGKVVQLILAGDKAGLLGQLPAVEGTEGDWLSEFLTYLRGVLLATLCGKDAPMLEGLALPAEALDGLVDTGRAIGGDRLEVWLQELLHARERMRLLPAHGRVILEVTLLDLCQVDATLPIAEWVARLEALEQGQPLAPRPAPGGAPPKHSGGATSTSTPAPVAAPKASPTARAAGPSPEPSTESSAGSAATPTPATNGNTPPANSGRSTPPADRAPQASAARSAPASELPTRELQPSARPGAARTGSVAETWEAFLAEVRQKAQSLADVLVRRARLAHLGGGRAVIELARLNDHERALLFDRRNRRTLQTLLEQITGESITLDLQDQAQVGDWSEDRFTADVVQRFEGRVES